MNATKNKKKSGIALPKFNFITSRLPQPDNSSIISIISHRFVWMFLWISVFLWNPSGYMMLLSGIGPNGYAFHWQLLVIVITALSIFVIVRTSYDALGPIGIACVIILLGAVYFVVQQQFGMNVKSKTSQWILFLLGILFLAIGTKFSQLYRIWSGIYSQRRAGSDDDNNDSPPSGGYADDDQDSNN